MESIDIFSNEISMRRSRKMESQMSLMHSQINRAISSAISDKLIHEIQKMMSSLSSRQTNTKMRTFTNNQEIAAISAC